MYEYIEIVKGSRTSHHFNSSFNEEIVLKVDVELIIFLIDQIKHSIMIDYELMHKSRRIPRINKI